MPNTTTPNGQTHYLRNLYFTRTAVQLAWAAVVLTQAISHPTLAASLLVAYPAWDVACTVYDLRASTHTASGRPAAQYVNAAFGVLATLGILLTVFHSPQQAVAVFGIWASAAGLAQLAVGLFRRKAMGGQWAMILSGLQSTAAGAAFIVGALHGTRHIRDLGGYAVFGGIYFLIAGLLLHRKLHHATAQAA